MEKVNGSIPLVDTILRGGVTATYWVHNPVLEVRLLPALPIIEGNIMTENAFTESELVKVNNVRDWYHDNKPEITKLNSRLDELRREFERAFDENDLNGIFHDVDERDDYSAWDTAEYRDVCNIAKSVGLGLSYEDYHLWEPSTSSC